MTFPGLVAADNLSDVVDRERAWSNIGSGIASNYLPEEYYDNVSLLLHGDGINGSKTIIDSSRSPKTVTAVGNAQISTAQSKFGGSSIAFDGNGDRLVVTNNSQLDLPGDFTIEAWVYQSASPPNFPAIFERGPATTAFLGWQLNNTLNTNTNLTFQYSNPKVYVDAGNLGTNQWAHVATTREGTLLRTFFNGELIATATISNNFTSTNNLIIADSHTATNLNPFKGFVDEFRITKGIARYTSNFTPPTAPFPPVLSIPATATIKGADILALEGVRNTSTRDFIFTKGLTSAAQPRITNASVATASGAFLRDNALLKTAPVSSGNYFFSSGLTLSGISTQINGTNALSIASSPFSGSTATTSLLFSELRPQANWRITEPMTAGTLASPELAVPFETEDFVLYMKAGQN